MNAAHFHLMLTHIPVLGTVFGLLLLGAGWVRHSDELRKVALWCFALFAVIAVPVFLTGEPAEELVEHLPGISEATIESHEETAKIAFGGILALGVIAVGGLVLLRKKPLPQWFTITVLVLALVTGGLLVQTANLGGKVRHTEIGAAASPTLAQP